jgi:hypothetical protein
MNFGTKEVVVSSGVSKGISYGIQKVKILDYQLFKAPWDPALGQVRFILGDDTEVKEGYDYEGELFGKQTATCRIATVDFTPYFNSATGDIQRTTNTIDNLLGIGFATIANNVGVREDVDKVFASSLEDYLKQVIKLIAGKSFWTSIAAKEYVNKGTGKVGLNREMKWFRNYNQDSQEFTYTAPVVKPVEGFELSVTGDIQTLTNGNSTVTWDKSRTGDYKPVDQPAPTPVEAPISQGGVSNDLPF